MYYEWNSLIHYGVKGMKWGVRKSKEQIRYERLIKRGEKHVDKYMRDEMGYLKVTDDWKDRGPHVPQRYKPYAVIETISGKHKQIDRTIYNGKGFMERQIHSMGHKKWRNPDYENGGAHAHEFVNGRRVSAPDGSHGRNLTEREKKEHGDIIGKRLQ